MLAFPTQAASDLKGTRSAENGVRTECEQGRCQNCRREAGARYGREAIAGLDLKVERVNFGNFGRFWTVLGVAGLSCNPSSRCWCSRRSSADSFVLLRTDRLMHVRARRFGSVDVLRARPVHSVVSNQELVRTVFSASGAARISRAVGPRRPSSLVCHARMRHEDTSVSRLRPKSPCFPLLSHLRPVAALGTGL
jgi:hypothetical protein